MDRCVEGNEENKGVVRLSGAFHLVLDGTVVRAPYSGVHNAVQHQIQAELAALPEARITVLGLAGSPVLSLAESAGAEALAVLPSDCGPLGRIYWQQVHLPGLLRHLGADIFHGMAYTLPLRTLACRTVLNVHDIIGLEHPELCARLNAWQMKLLLPGSIRKADRLFVSTRHVSERIQKALGIPQDALTVVPLGVDSERFQTARPWPSELPPDRPYFLFVSNLEPKKDLMLLLNAYGRCADALQADLVIAGRAAWKCTEEVRRLEHWMGAGNVRWLHYVSDDGLPGLYQHALAFVFPSKCEGFGLPVLEAMAAGTPVIHSDHPAVMEAAGGYGVPFPVGDARALAELLEERMKNPGRFERVSRLAKEYAMAQSWRKWADITAAAIRDLWRR